MDPLDLSRTFAALQFEALQNETQLRMDELRRTFDSSGLHEQLRLALTPPTSLTELARLNLQSALDFSRVHEGVRQIEELRRSLVPSTSLFELASRQIEVETQVRVEGMKRLLETETLRMEEIRRAMEPTTSMIDLSHTLQDLQEFQRSQMSLSETLLAEFSRPDIRMSTISKLAHEIQFALPPRPIAYPVLPNPKASLYRKISELEARVKDLEAQLNPPAPPDPPKGTDGPGDHTGQYL